MKILLVDDSRAIAMVTGARLESFGHQVKLRLLDLKTKVVKDLTEEFYGGQGTINVPSWSPDGKKFAYVRYALEDL